MLSRSCLKVKVKGQDHHVKKRDFHALCLVYLICNIEVKGHWMKVKGHMGQGQRSHGSKSNKDQNTGQIFIPCEAW